MVKLLIILLMICFTSSLQASEPQGKSVEVICGYTGWDCKDIPDPKVVYTRIVSNHDNYGMYLKGDSVVLIRPNMATEFSTIIITHEKIHYLQYKLQKESTTPCQREEEARRIVSLIHNIAYSTDWEETYGCGKFAEKKGDEKDVN